MKNYLKATMVALGLGLLCFLGYKVVAKMEYKSNVAQSLKTLPEFSFETLDNQLFTQKNIDTDKPLVFIYFNSECDYCMHEAQAVEEHIDRLKGVQLIFVSFESKEIIKQFSKQYKLKHYDNITFLSDPRGDFANRFDATSIPYILVYNSNQELVKRHQGQLNIDTLVSILK